MLTNGFENRYDVDVFAIVTAGLDRAAVNKNSGAIHPRHRHHTSRHVFVATTDRNDAIHSFAADNGFDRISNDLAAYQRVFHTFGSHRDTVRNRDRIEFNRFATGSVRAFHRLFRELVDVHVAWRDHAPSRSDTDDRLLKIFVFKTDRVKHRAARCTVRSVQHWAGELAMRRSSGRFLFRCGFFNGSFLCGGHDFMSGNFSQESTRRKLGMEVSCKLWFALFCNS